MAAASSFEIAKEFYKTDKGYRAINNYLSCAVHGTTRYRNVSRMCQTNLEEKLDLSTIVRDLRSGMKPIGRLNSKLTFYRGDVCQDATSFRLETFLSLSRSKSHAESFIPDVNGCLFEVILDADVEVTRYMAEDETLVQDGCIWEYLGKKNGVHRVQIHGPGWEGGEHLPWKGEIIQSIPTFSATPSLPKTMNELRREWLSSEKNEEINWLEGGRKRVKSSRRRRSRRRSRRQTTKSNTHSPPSFPSAYWRVAA